MNEANLEYKVRELVNELGGNSEPAQNKVSKLVKQVQDGRIERA